MFRLIMEARKILTVNSTIRRLYDLELKSRTPVQQPKKDERVCPHENATGGLHGTVYPREASLATNSPDNDSSLIFGDRSLARLGSIVQSTGCTFVWAPHRLMVQTAVPLQTLQHLQVLPSSYSRLHLGPRPVCPKSWVLGGSLAGIVRHHSLACLLVVELVCRADFSCNRHCNTIPAHLGQVWPKNIPQ